MYSVVSRHVALPPQRPPSSQLSLWFVVAQPHLKHVRLAERVKGDKLDRVHAIKVDSPFALCVRIAAATLGRPVAQLASDELKPPVVATQSGDKGGEERGRGRGSIYR